jgi:hypothetical protein
MVKETLKRIFKFLEEKEEHKAPFLWKLENNIPLTEEDLNIEGDLNLHSYKKLTSLPKGLKVGGSLSLIFADIESLPEGLKVGDNLYLQHSKITSLPEGLEVGDNIYISNSKLKNRTNDELIKMIKTGFIKGEIRRK